MLKTIVDDYINLDYLINSLDIWNNNIFLQLKENHIGLCDKKTPETHTTKIKKFIRTFNKDMSRMTDTCCCNAVINDKNILFRLYSHKNKHIFFISIEEEYYHCVMTGIIDSDEDKFLFVGVENSHPFYVSEKISYANSDGSGPNIEIYYEMDYYELYEIINEHFNDFSNDKWH
jgi:hypothetical protein